MISLHLVVDFTQTTAKIFTPFTIASMLFISLKLLDKLIQSTKTMNGVVILAITLCIRSLQPLKREVLVEGLVMASSAEKFCFAII